MRTREVPPFIKRKKPNPVHARPKAVQDKWKALALVLLALLVLVALCAYLYTRWLRGLPPPPPRPEPNVQVGEPTEADALEELQRQVDESMLTFGINATASFENGASPGNLMIDNPKENGSRFTVTIERRDTGETVYTSGTLEPGQYMDQVTLDVALPAGEYPCTAWFDAYRLADSGYIGRAGAEITLYIFN